MTTHSRNAVPSAPSIPSAVAGEGDLRRGARGLVLPPFSAPNASSSATAALVSNVSASACVSCERNRHATPDAARARPAASASAISTDSTTSAAPDSDSETPSLCRGFSSRRSAVATAAAKTSWKCLRLRNALRGSRKTAWLMSAVARTSANATGARRDIREARRLTTNPRNRARPPPPPPPPKPTVCPYVPEAPSVRAAPPSDRS